MNDKGLKAELARHRIVDGARFRLKDHDPGDTGAFGADGKAEAKTQLAAQIEKLSELQQKLYAQNSWAMLAVFQAMDAAGKDSTIEHVMSGINPQGCEVHAFKAPSTQELDHDFLWRCAQRAPERGRIGIFNRSYYEEVLVVRVHPEFLKAQRLPALEASASRRGRRKAAAGARGESFWEERLDDIANYERYLARQGYVVLKFFLNVSKEAQKSRFLERLDQHEKNWKFSIADVEERKHWDAYMDAYESAIRATAAPHAPWYVIPADRKWYARLVVAAAMVDALSALKLEFPDVDPAKRDELAEVRQALLDE